VTWLFTVTLFVSSALLFLVQPLVARLVLPRLGGSPAVWNTCMVFFQAALLAGYAYAHSVPRWLGVRRQALLHLGLMLLPLAVLPLGIPEGWTPPDNADPVWWLLALLLVSVGLPFLVVATSGPLLQRWFAATAAPTASDPYFLYSASNLGSMLALLAYPLLVEPTCPLRLQSWLWTAGYLVLLGLTAACAVAVWRSPEKVSGRAVSGESSKAQGLQPLGLGASRDSPPTTGMGWQRLYWVLLAFVPSSLLLSVTTYLTTDIAAIPLLWVLPLALYLLTFILVFARKPLLSTTFLARWLPLVVLVVVLTLLSEATEPGWLLLSLHLLGLFWISLVCHGELARSRPAAEHLTAFYLWLAVGGVLGGLFNALLAPLLFNTVTEYPLVLVLACLLCPAAATEGGGVGGWGEMVARLTASRRTASPAGQAGRGRNHHAALTTHHFWPDLLLPAGLGLLGVVLLVAFQYSGLTADAHALPALFGGLLVLCYLLRERPARFGLGIGAILLASTLAPGVHGRLEYRTRSFFGVHRVTLDPTGSFRVLVHGNTDHGRQSLDPERRREPLVYYHRTGPIGQVFAALEGDDRLARVGVVGLGAGTLACYADKGQQWTYFEIDPAVEGIAEERFTFLGDARQRGADVNVVLGDARLTLARCRDRFGLLVIDAFSSDAIPVHLLTREALRIYEDHLTDDGIVAFNISNRYLNLKPVLANLARAQQPAWTCLVQDDLTISEAQKMSGKSESQWLVLLRRPEDRQRLAYGSWTQERGQEGRAVWTDDYSNLLRVWKWE
jgi:hypothetical protein